MPPERARLDPSRAPRRLPTAVPATTLLLLLATALVRADDPPADTSALAMTRSRIAELSTALASDRTDLSAAREHGFELERLIAATASQLPGYARRIAEKEAAIKALRESQQRLQPDLDEARAVLARNVLARYVIAMQPRMKVLLNQREASALSRTMTYYEYTQRAYASDFAALNDKLLTATKTEQALAADSATLRQLHTDNEARLAELEAARIDHAKLVTAIEARMADGEVRVAELRRDEQRLIQLLDKLAAPRPIKPAAKFASRRGKLALPANGRVAKAPGAALRKDGARWAGVFIASPAGTGVTAIAPGTVVFADWFRNLGKLVIIDHGDNYLTLYGNNAEVLKNAGDSVDAGDTIATVSAGTGDLPAGVYFELRKRGEPIDPRSWFARR